MTPDPGPGGPRVPNTPEDFPPGWTPALAANLSPNGHTPAPAAGRRTPPPPPHDLDLERLVLASALAGYDDQAAQLTARIQPGDFYSPAHGLIWRHIAALVDQAVVPEPALLAARLTEARHLDRIGGHPALVDIVATAPNSANATAYADQILDLAHRRRILRLGTDIAAAARAGIDPSDLVADLQGGPDHGAPAADRIRSALLDTAALRALPPPRPLVEGWLNLDSLAMLYGASGSYKTFLALDLAAHVATGTWWHGHRVQAAPVLYVIAEGVAGLSKRIDAWQHHHQIHDLAAFQPVRWLPQAINLTELIEVDALAQVAADLRPGLIVFDTLARCIAGAEENSAKDMGAVVTHLDRIRRATNACVLIVHHAGKDGTLGARGSSAIRGAVDTELELSKTEDRIRLRCPKQKDLRAPSDIPLGVTPVLESAVLVPSHQALEPDDLPAKTAEVLDQLRTIATPGGISSTTWREICLENGASRSGFYAAVSGLVRAGLVQNLGSDKRPLYIPSDLVLDEPATNSPEESKTVQD